MSKFRRQWVATILHHFYVMQSPAPFTPTLNIEALTRPVFFFVSGSPRPAPPILRVGVKGVFSLSGARLWPPTVRIFLKMLLRSDDHESSTGACLGTRRFRIYVSRSRPQPIHSLTGPSGVPGAAVVKQNCYEQRSVVQAMLRYRAA